MARTGQFISINLSPDVQELRGDVSFLLQDAVPRSYSRAINRSVDRTQTEAKRRIATEARVTVTMASKRMRVFKRATEASPSSILGMLVAPASAKELGSVRLKKSVPAITAGRGTTRREFPMAFQSEALATGQIFKRARASDKRPAFEAPVGTDLVGRLPIHRVDIPLQPHAQEQLDETAEEIIDREFEPEFFRLLKVEAQKRGFR